MNLSNIIIILDRPGESRNIGSVCRAMANCSISTLRIVGTKLEDIDIEAVHRLAIHAANIFDQATYFETIEEATKDCCLAAGTTRRPGKKRKGKLLLPEEFADVADKSTDSKGDGARTAIIFGNEQSGLSDEEIESCDFGVTIPSSETFGSLNLSHAVQIICYSLFRKGIKNNPNGREAVNRTDVTNLVNYMLEDLQQIGFFSYHGKENMGELWTSILSRAALSKEEAILVQRTFDRIASMTTHSPLAHPSALHTK